MTPAADQPQKNRKQCVCDGDGLGLGRLLGLGLTEPEVPPGLGVADWLAAAECVALADGEALAEREREGGLVRETLVPSELSTDTPVSLGDAAGGRIVVAAPLVIEGPLSLISTYPPAASTMASTAPTTIARRLRWDLPCPPRPDDPRRSLRREVCAAGAERGGAGSHTALIAGP